MANHRARRRPADPRPRFTAAPSDVPFVGRAEQLETLCRALNDAARGVTRVVAIRGEAGIGKTSLAREIARRAAERGMETYWGYCTDSDGAPALWPWSRMVRAMVDCHGRRLLPEGPHAELLLDRSTDHRRARPPEPFPGTRTPSERSFLIYDAVTSVITRLARQVPLLCVLDNLHAADRPSLQLAEHLALTSIAVPLLFLCTYRSVGVPPSPPLAATLGELARATGFQELSLSGLTRDDVREALRSRWSGASDSLVDAVYRRSEGNPLYLREIVRLLRGRGGGEQNQALEVLGKAGVPSTILHLIRTRLQGLTRECVETLRIAALMGREIEPPALSAVVGVRRPERLENCLEEGLRSGVLEVMTGTGPRFRFSHALVRDALVEDLSSVRRAQLHGRIGTALEEFFGPAADHHASELARHYAESLSLATGAGVLRYSRIAADEALARGDFEAAIAHYNNALRAPGSAAGGGNVAGFYLGRGRAELAAGRGADGLRSLARGFELMDGLGRRDDAIRAVSYLPLNQFYGDPVAQDLTERVLRRTRPGTVPWALLNAQLQALRRPRGEEARDARRLMSLSLQVTRSRRDEDAELRVLTLQTLLNYLSLCVRPASVQRLVRLAHRKRDPCAAANGHLIELYLAWFYPAGHEDYTTVRKHLDAALFAAEATRDRDLLGKTLISVARAHFLQGEWSRAKDAITRACSLSPVLELGSLPSLRCRIAYETGEMEAGRRELDSYMTNAGKERSDSSLGKTEICALIADIAHETHDRELLGHAADMARRARAVPELAPMTRWRWLVSHGLVAAELGQTALAQRLHDEIASMRAELPLLQRSNPRSVARIARAAGRLDVARREYEIALEHLGAIGSKVDLGWACYDYADLLAHGNGEDRARATTCNQGALSAAGAIGLPVLGARARELAESLAHGAGDAVPGQLTAREIAVIAHIALGKTNKEISRDLVISEHTVASHVRNILSKIGVASRTEAATFAVRRGLAGPEASPRTTRVVV